MTALPAAQTSATKILPSYLYVEYSDDDDLAAFVSVFNEMAQGYLDWFNGTPLALYTSDAITGLLLDWVGTYLYDIPRPVLGNFKTFSFGALNTAPVNTLPVNGVSQFTFGSASPVTDDIYKRVLTWWIYAGDGKQMSIDWIKRRVARFMNGVNGSDIVYPPSNPPSIALGASKVVIGAVNSHPLNTLPVDGSGAVTQMSGFTITVPTGDVAQILQSLISDGLLALPFEDNFTVVLD